ncbi:hypothetical protein IQ268_10400 [Oculatella sp. LEGE 06141]|uniref:hypothetical protein n=1 Tax=Oculatella sp. LEGE 06141 TaxID=1828648 RepID=UPI00187F9610|nr:hypothetical protein [Oculatella sp. LEGE 06141]MBE9178972.1 hypothetical protein [Oculatella sp. LEGE 06141]
MNGLNLETRPSSATVEQTIAGNVSRFKSNRNKDRVLPQPNIVLLDGDRLSPGLIDALAEAQNDWISLLHPDWELEIDDPRGVGIADSNRAKTRDHLTVQELVALTRPVPYQSTTIDQQVYWTHTRCLQVIGFGRSRLVVSFSHYPHKGDPVAFLTNRLDWSPRKVMLHWLRCSSPSGLCSSQAL